MRILIKNGAIADGSGGPLYDGGLLLEGERIALVGQIPDVQADVVIDGKGLVAAPGFIDTHSHSDLCVLTEPKVLPKIMQGITTEVLGQDGISMAPLPERYISPWRKNIGGLDGVSDRINWHYRTTDGYLTEIEKAGPGLNEAYLVPHGNIRMEAMGLSDGRPTKRQMDDMCAIVRREMDTGAIGLSSGLIYMPCAYAETGELIELCRAVAEKNGIFVVHQRSEADAILRSMDEIIEVGRKSGVKLHFSHFKVCGKTNWDKIGPVIEKLEAAEREGLDITYDQYPYVAGSTMLGVVLPPWAHDGGTDELLRRLGDRAQRDKIRRDIESPDGDWDNFVRFAGLDKIYVMSVKTAANRDAVGKNLIQLGEMRGKEPLEAVFDLLLEEENAVGMVDYYGLEDHIKLFMSRPEMNVCTDGLLSDGKPHPRVYGAFPRVLGKYVREEKCLRLEEAVHKMTGKPAATMNIRDRGLLKPGYFADVVLFDPLRVRDTATFLDPMQFPEGIEYVIVNGGVAVEKGRHTGLLNGRVLRNGR